MLAILSKEELCYIYEEFNKYKLTIHSDHIDYHMNIEIIKK